jgi:hypothetical protein
MYVYEMLKKGLLDGASTKRDEFGIFVLLDWNGFMERGEYENDLMRRFFLLDLEAEPIKGDPKLVVNKVPCFYLSRDEIHIGRYNTKKDQEETLLFFIGVEDQEFESTNIFFANLLTCTQ